MPNGLSMKSLESITGKMTPINLAFRWRWPGGVLISLLLMCKVSSNVPHSTGEKQAREQDDWTGF